MVAVDLKESILDAVERVVSRQGLAGTTAEAIALEAGISKGGSSTTFPARRRCCWESWTGMRSGF